MNGVEKRNWGRCEVGRWGTAGLLSIGLVVALMVAPAAAQREGRPSVDRHVPELAKYLSRVEIAEPIVHRNLRVYPVLLEEGADRLEGSWLTLDEAIQRGDLEVNEKGGGSVPIVEVENRSRSRHVFIMSGEVISGGKQTRTVRDDVVLAPGQKVELKVFCVEAHRWEGGKQFAAGKAVLPQSIQKELRKGADQQQVWSEVARNNRALSAENDTGSLERALNAAPVRRQLDEVRRSIAPQVPRGTVGFIFVSHGRAIGADFFGRDDLAEALLPKLLDSYAVDFVLQSRAGSRSARGGDDSAAIEFYERICRAGSDRAGTPGSGAGIRTRADRLLGDGVSLSGTLVHFGVQINERIIPKPIIIHPRPPRRIYPPAER